MAFKDEKTLLTRALLIPGGAYFYTGQALLGVLTGIIEALFTVFSVVSIVEAAGVNGLGPDPGGASQRPLLLTRAVIYVAFLALMKFTSFYRGRRRVRRYIPA